MLPDALQAPVVMQDLVDHVQNAVHGFRVICCGGQGLGVPRTERPLQNIQQGLSVLTYLKKKQNENKLDKKENGCLKQVRQVAH